MTLNCIFQCYYYNRKNSGIIYLRNYIFLIQMGCSTRKAIAHEAATNISSSKPFALVSSNALRTEGNTTALLIWAGFQYIGGKYFRIWIAFS